MVASCRLNLLPEVAVITPYKDAESFIYDFVAMLQAQTHSDWLCILVDDGSTDSGPRILSALAKVDPRLLPVVRPGSKESLGPADARNYALSLVSSPYIAFCDIDDIWHPDKLEAQLHFHLSNNLQISVTGYGRFHLSPEPLVFSLRCPPSSLTYSHLLFHNALPMLTVMVNRSILEAPFPLCRHEDYACWLEIFRRHRHIRYGCLPLVLAFYRVHPGNLTSHRWKMLFWANDAYRAHGLSVYLRIPLIACWSLIQLYMALLQFISRARSVSLDYLIQARPPVLLR